jgi:hypothetical protein
MMVMIVGLGLIHGFGLSTRLQELPLREDQLLLNIISFNVGIELGQISALAIMLLLIAAWRHGSFFQTFSVITNYALIIMGGFLFLMQMHGYEHTTKPEEFIVRAALATELEGDSSVAPDSKSSGDSQQSAWKDVISMTIPARGDVEYKLFVKKGDTFAYSWDADGKALFYDFHGEPAGDTTGYFESFKKGTETQSSGSLMASFNGTHGWYWKNNSGTSVIMNLRVKGDYQLVRPKDNAPSSESLKEVETLMHDTID